ncbi:GNAT family N-acetyltransferase [Saccharibacillus kuerlensis]|uniref:N-acetyltransferase domain-containing protein n=1 Tax=Saccharibacillus kuerlensis TaxID=459527 RepID=A0ABQ2L0V0_9BACL|nr:GNAT family N-acetyltransferase [Saccharibacillus kuerlensis]GGN98835.1 hypothetical protein GCM10010969_18400 [Saccharibacillus kuerlensis]
MTTYRLLKAQELTEAVRLSDSVFRPQTQPSMGEMFPRLFAPGIVHSYGAFSEDGTLASFMGLAPSTLRIGVNRDSIRAFSIGSVCTAPEHRGAGHAGRLLQQCIAHAARAEAPLLFVSGERSLYTRAGCVPFGRSANVVLRPPGSAEGAPLLLRQSLYEPGAVLPALTLREAGPEELLRLHALHAAENISFDESAAGLGELLGAAAYCGVLGLTQRIILASIEHEPVAYAVIGVPPHLQHDFNDGVTSMPSAQETPSENLPTVIAYGGTALHAADLLSGLPETLGLEEIHVPVPWQDRELLALLQKTDAEVSYGPNAGTLLIIDARQLLEQAQGLWHRPWEEALRVDKQGRLFAASSGRELDRSEWAGLLFDPEYPRPDDLPNWLIPIPLPYLYGLHYI